MHDKDSLRARLQQLKAEYALLKSEVSMKKVCANGTFGKLGSPYCSFYAPDLLLAVTMTGQLNLMCLIYALEFSPEVQVISANTDGIMVKYPLRLRDRLLSVVADNAKRTGYDYEETCYEKVALANVNNYFAVTSGRDPALISAAEGISFGKGKRGKVKRKGLYAESGLMKNPTMNVCANMVADYLRDGTAPWDSIEKYTDIRDYVEIRNVKGGGIQYEKLVEVDDWVQVADREWRRQAWLDSGSDRASVKRKSRPAPVQVGVGGQAFGRVARWYMKQGGTLPINYVGSGNKVPGTDGARLCMTLPDTLPDDLDKGWYINEALSIMSDIGAPLPQRDEKLAA